MNKMKYNLSVTVEDHNKQWQQNFVEMMTQLLEEFSHVRYTGKSGKVVNFNHLGCL